MKSNYFAEADKLEYPYASRIVIFLISLGMISLMLTLISVLAFSWKENTIWWSSCGALIYTLVFAGLVKKDRVAYDTKRHELEVESR